MKRRLAVVAVALALLATASGAGRFFTRYVAHRDDPTVELWLCVRPAWDRIRVSPPPEASRGCRALVVDENAIVGEQLFLLVTSAPAFGFFLGLALLAAALSRRCGGARRH